MKIERVLSKHYEKIEAKTDNFWQDEYKYIKSNEDVIDVYDRGYLILDEQGKPVRFVGAIQDITHRKAIEAERENIIRELTDSNNNLRQFSFITSHNLRAPLANIVSILNIPDTDDSGVTNKQMLGLLKASVYQLQETINDLTNIIVIRNKEYLKSELLGLKNVFNNVRKGYLNTLHNVAYILEENFKVEQAVLNKSYLESIFINLITNAVKYRLEKRLLEISVSTTIIDDNQFEIKFSDNGKGLNASKLKDRLFGMYQRFHDKTEGKGLELFMVKSQVAAMGGTIEMEGQVNQGLTIRIKLPLSGK